MHIISYWLFEPYSASQLLAFLLLIYIKGVRESMLNRFKSHTAPPLANTFLVLTRSLTSTKVHIFHANTHYDYIHFQNAAYYYFLYISHHRLSKDDIYLIIIWCIMLSFIIFTWHARYLIFIYASELVIFKHIHAPIFITMNGPRPDIGIDMLWGFDSFREMDVSRCGPRYIAGRHFAL